jgi:hypothetical protein
MLWSDPTDRSELLVCDELFFSGTAVGIAPIVRVNHRPVCNGTMGAVSRSISTLYSDAVHGRLRGYSHWLTPVYEGHGNHGQNLVSTSVADSGSLRPQRIQACLMKLN